jgi:O-antigen/teichoic acid export membrane protein
LGLAAVLTPVVIGAMVAMYPFLNVWIGAERAAAAAPVGVLLLVGVWANGMAFVPHALLQGQGRPDLPAKFHLGELVPYLLLLWLGLRLGGLSGAAVAWVVRAGVDAGLLFYASRLLRREMLKLAPAIGLVLVGGGAMLAADGRYAPQLALGTALAFLALWWAWQIMPAAMRQTVGDVLGPRSMLLTRLHSSVRRVRS